MMKRQVTFILCLLLLLFALSSCGNGAASEDKQEVSPGYNTGASLGYDTVWDTDDKIYEDTVLSGESTDTSVAPDTGTATDRKIIKTATIRAETLLFDQCTVRLKQTVSTLDGYFSSSDISGYQSYYDSNGNETSLRSGNFTVKIPAEQYDVFLSSVEELCTVLSSTESESDVTLQYVDIQSRIDAYRAEEASLIAMLDKAETVNQLIEIQDRLSTVRYQMESYQSQLNVLQNQVAYSTVHLYLSEVKEITRTEEYTSVGDEIGEKLKQNLADIGDGFTNGFIWFVSNLPYILLWVLFFGIPFGIVLLIVRKARRRSARTAAPSVETGKENDPRGGAV